MIAIEPMPLETLTITGFDELASSGMNTCVTRTSPTTLVAKTRSTSAGVTSGTGTIPPEIPALLTSTSSAPTVSTAAATLASSVTSSAT